MLLDWPQLETSFRSEFGSQFILHEANPVSGGDINLAFELITNKGKFFAKLNTPDKIEAFVAERDGLVELSKCDSLKVPEPFAVGQNAHAAYFCMEFIEFAPDVDQRGLGEVLAELHEPMGQQFGWDRNNFLGTSVQHNQWSEDWADFFWTQRLEPQLYLLLDASSSFPEAVLNPLQSKVRAALGDERYTPSLVHGDLWHGNAGTTLDGKACLYDPAVYWGHSETDIAMARLFGGFQEEFFIAYESSRVLIPESEHRIQIYQLYHLLNHFNLFGASYLEQCTRHIQRIMQS